MTPSTASPGPLSTVVWALPFAGMLLSIALLPLVAPGFWHRRTGSVALGWCASFLVPFAAAFGIPAAVHELAHAVLREYLPFTLLMAALYTAAGGIHVRGDLRGGPALNTAMLAAGALLASVMGTTGAAMLLIRPLLRANAHRASSVHIVVFFIFIVGNIGGALTPLGDPPLLLGFLQGVDFFWTTTHLFLPMLALITCLLLIFFLLDRHLSSREHAAAPLPGGDAVGLDGAINLLPLLGIVALVLMSGAWKPGVVLMWLGIDLPLQDVVRDLGMALAVGLSLVLTPAGVRASNEFSWAPMKEVAALFIGIFVTMIPVLAMLKAGEAGPFGAVVRAVTGPAGEPLPWAYFWVTGVLSSFLDNAPTYLVFFQVAGGDAPTLMTELAGTLAAISAGAVFMGAMTYIGNAPNFMIRAIAESRGVRMPGFFGYMAWSGTILLPLFFGVTLLFFL